MASEFEILFEDENLLAVSKPTGLLSEATGGDEESMLSRVSAHLGKQAILYHRIDRGTTGCLLFGKTPRFNRQIAQLFCEKKIRKEYWAVVPDAWPKGQNKVDARIESLGQGKWRTSDSEGKASLTTFREMGRADGFVWLAALPKTGRTHQIRLHCMVGGASIVGDRDYGGDEASEALMLHARSLRFRHPGTGKSMEILAGLPPHWDEWAERFPRMRG